MNITEVNCKIIAGCINIGLIRLEDFSTNDIHLFEIDLISKYASCDAYSSGNDISPKLFFGATETTIKLNPHYPNDSFTELEFPSQYLGWEIYAISNIGRYTCNVVLIKRST